MANQPIGVTFIPTEDAAAQGQKRGSLEGSGGSDLAEAFKVISLHLPRFLGSRALASPGLLNGPGAAGVSGGFNPHAAVFDALLKAMNGGGDLAQTLSSL